MYAEYLRVGATIAPKVGQTIGYAVIIEIEQEKHPEGKTLYTVLTDFGSIFKMNWNELSSAFTNVCYGAVCPATGNFEYLDPFDFNLKERWLTQQLNLLSAETELKEKGLL